MGKVVSQSFDQVTVYNDKIIPGSMGEKVRTNTLERIFRYLEGWREACWLRGAIL